MLGAIIGDIVGSRFEFNNHRSTDFELFHKDCGFTDDTICTVAVADWVMSPAISLTKTMRYWCRRYPSSYGGAFIQWIHNESMGPYYSFGNGAAMRVSPVGFYAGAAEEAVRLAERSAVITHDHPEGIRGAKCIAGLIWLLRKGVSKKDIRLNAQGWYAYDMGPTCDQIRKTNTFDETCQVTVPQAIQCFLESTNFEDAIRLAVSIGGDSDTIAAITGSLAEAHYGIPPWMILSALGYLPEDMIDVINKFYSKFPNGKRP